MTSKNSASVANPSATIAAGLERIEAGHARFIEAVGTARAGAARVTDKLVENVLTGQRDALLLTKAFVAQPTEYGKNIEAMLQSLTAAQERTLELAKTVYRANSEVAADARAAAARVLESGKGLGKPFENLTSLWTKATK